MKQQSNRRHAQGVIPVARPWLPPIRQYQALLKDIWQSRMLSNFGKYASKFESQAQTYLANQNARIVGSCDLGLIMAIKALGLRENSECVVPSFTFQSTVNAAVWNRLIPRFVDIDPQTFTIDPKEVSKHINRKTSLILGTHVFGNPCHIDELQQLSKDYKIPLVFDAAHAFGSMYRGKKIGNFGDCEAFSFSGTKLITSAEGGLVTARNRTLADKIEYMREYGFRNDYNGRYVGLNGKMSELNAALGCLTIEHTESIIGCYQRIAERYKRNLTAIQLIEFQKIDQRNRCTFKDFAIVCQQGRDRLYNCLSAAGIQCKKYFYPVHMMHAFGDNKGLRLQHTEDIYRGILCLPIHAEMSLRSVDVICELIEGCYRHRRRRAPR